MERDQAEHFAENLRRAREARGLSARQAAAAGAISDTTWRRLENAEELLRYDPRAGTLRGIAKALSIKLDQVYHWAGKTFHGIDPPMSLEEALSERDGQHQVPAALAGVWGRLTEDQRQRVLGYAQALAGEHDH